MADTYMLDTNVVIALAGSGGFESLPKRVQRLLNAEDVKLVISTITEFEIAQKHRVGKLAITREELTNVCSEAAVESLPFRQRHSLRLFVLPMHHRDPFDRMIISHAVVDEIPLISSNEQFRNYEDLNLVWR